MDGYEFIAYRPEWRDQVIELQKHLWSPDPALNAAYLEWKHERNPYTSQPSIYLILCGGRVVGMRSFQGMQWEAGKPGISFPGPCACDLLIAPEHRNRGLLTPLLQFAHNDLARRGVEYCFNTSAGMTTYLSAVATGWRDIGSLQPMGYSFRSTSRTGRLRAAARRVPVLKAIYRRARGLPDPVASPPQVNDAFARFDARVLGKSSTLKGGVTAGRSPQPVAMARLIERRPWDGRVRVRRDAAYLSWRFRNPLSQYRFLYSGGGADLDGFLVLQVSIRPGWDEVNIVDWEAGSAMIRRRLLRSALAAGEFSVLRIWTASLDAETRTILREEGFVTIPTPASLTEFRPSILVRCMTPGRPPTEWKIGGRLLTQVRNWDVRMIVSEGV